jgi:hypothetical protein
MSQPVTSVDRSRDLQHSIALSHRILVASEHLFGSAPIGGQIANLASQFENRCRDILSVRSGDLLTIAVVGSKGQGKTWVAKQLVLDATVQAQLPSGVLSTEATNRLFWIGTVSPVELDTTKEVFVRCDSSSLVNLGFPYICLDTPGTTDANQNAAVVASSSMGIAPVQLLVIRRDQLRSATASQIVSQSEGILCVPIITAIPLRELSTNGAASDSLQSDVRYWMATLRSAAPRTIFQEPIFLLDFEASGDESAASDYLRSELTNRFHESNMKDIGNSTSNRLASATSRLKYDVVRVLESSAPQLATAVIQMQDAANGLPRKAIDSVLGTDLVLETAVRSRLRTQMVTDTSSLWFPYRSTLALLALSQGAWDRLVMAMSGSIPSIFGTFFAWAKNVQLSRKLQWDIQEGLRERLNSQAIDLLQPIQRQFHVALAELRGSQSWETGSLTGFSGSQSAEVNHSVRLAGIDELQLQSQALFNEVTDRKKLPRGVLALTALAGVTMFWILLSGPIFSVYRQYLNASLNTFFDVASHSVDEFPHPSPSLLLTSVILSFLPMLIYAMIVMTFLLRRSKILQISKLIQADQRRLVDRLQDEHVLRLDFQDASLQHAHFLLALDRMAKD